LKTQQKLLAAMLAVLPLATLSLTSSVALAQTSNVSYAPRITGFNVDEVRRLLPGTELNFDLYGTPGGRATIYIAGAYRNLTLIETEPGQYQGAYTLSARDRITGASKVSANLRVGNVVASDVLSESLLRAAGRRGGRHDQASNTVRIARFDVQGNDDLNPGSELVFRIRGTPGAKVDMSIEGARGIFFLPEVQAGEYEGSYIITRRDRIASNSVVTANLRYDNRVATATLGKPLMIAAAPANVPRVVRYCSNCATVEAIHLVQVNGEGNYLGAIGGGVVGALLGSQVGGGNGKTAAQVAGAVGGAYVGRNIERNARKTQHTEVVIRYDNGGTQTMTYENDPGLRTGDKVKVNNGVLTRDN
jgi:outer membrane lipoprotein SlyB